MRDLDQKIASLGIRSIVIGLGDESDARAFKAKMEFEMPLYVDADRVAYRAAGFSKGSLLHLFRGDNKRARIRAAAAGHRQTGIGKNPMQLGGTLVIASDDRILLDYRSRTFGDNASVEVISEALGKL